MRSDISEIQIPLCRGRHSRSAIANGIPAPAAIGPTLRLMVDVARPGHAALLESALGSVVSGSLKTRPRVTERGCLTGVCIGSAERSAEPRVGEFNRRRRLRQRSWTMPNVLANDRHFRRAAGDTTAPSRRNGNAAMASPGEPISRTLCSQRSAGRGARSETSECAILSKANSRDFGGDEARNKGDGTGEECQHVSNEFSLSLSLSPPPPSFRRAWEMRERRERRDYVRACTLHTLHTLHTATLMNAHVTQGRAITLSRGLSRHSETFFLRGVAESPFYS